MLGYGQEPEPSATWNIAEEVTHLLGRIDAQGIERLHLVAHSLGSMFAMHLRLALGPRVTRMTLVDPVHMAVLREHGETDAAAEMEDQYKYFVRLLPDQDAAARAFTDHWNGAGAWDAVGERARQKMAALVPRVLLEMNATRTDHTPVAVLAANPPRTTILVGERTKVAPPATAKHLAKAFGADIILVPGAGHMIPLSHPAAICDAVTRP